LPVLRYSETSILVFPRTSDRRSHALRIASRVACSVLLALSALVVLPAFALAAWSASPTQNLPVCTARGIQIYRTAISDGAGGIITAWSDTRSDTADVYAQHIDAGGNVLWGSNGTLVCGAPRDQDQPVLASDGAGGAIIVWRDFRGGATGDLYAQHLDAAGVRQWSLNGLGVCTASDEQANPVAVSDGGGGVIIAWEDWRSSTPCIYAQRVTGGGQAKWRAGGRPLSSGFLPMFAPVALADGLGGSYVAWLQQGGTSYDLYGQHVEADSTLRWTAAGSAICTAPGDQLQPVLALSGVPLNASSAGVFVVWQDRRGVDADLYGQRFNYYGVPYWTANGVSLCAWSADQTDPVVTADNTGGMLCVWHDMRGGNEDLYAQRVDANAVAKWTTGGLVICNAANTQQFPALASDGQGGAIIAWEDDRSGASDIYAQRITPSGSKRWAPNGAPVTTAPSAQYQATVVTNADSVAIVMWQDQRASGSDLYAQRIPFALTLDAPPLAAEALLLAAGPEPTAGDVNLRFTLAQAQPCELAVFDAAGRRVSVLASGVLAAGVQERRWNGRDAQGAAAADGVYFARLAIAGHTAATRRITLRR
jgi:hypothetical protein